MEIEGSFIDKGDPPPPVADSLRSTKKVSIREDGGNHKGDQGERGPFRMGSASGMGAITSFRDTLLNRDRKGSADGKGGLDDDMKITEADYSIQKRETSVFKANHLDDYIFWSNLC